MKKKLLIAGAALAVVGVVAGLIWYNSDWGARESKVQESEITQQSEKVQTEEGAEVNDMTELKGIWKSNSDPTKSELLWKVASIKEETRGAFEEFEVTLEMGQSLQDSKLVVVIDAASINSENEMRDEHLREEDFFHVAKYPEIRFESSSIELTKDGYIAHGKLSLHGVSQDMDVKFDYEGRGDYEDGREFAAFRGTMDVEQANHDMVDEPSEESLVKGSFYVEMVRAEQAK